VAPGDGNVQQWQGRGREATTTGQNKPRKIIKNFKKKYCGSKSKIRFFKLRPNQGELRAGFFGSLRAVKEVASP